MKKQVWLPVFLATTCLVSSTHALTLDFSNFAPGESIEGSGTVHPLLTITALSGDGVALFEGKDPAAYGSPNPGIQNGGIAPTGGFGDISPGRSHDFVFTFNGGYTVNHFSLHMLDYGDANPGLATSHSITLEALDTNGASVDMHTLSYTGDADRLAGDAAASPGQPGNFIFTVSGPGISMVRLLYSNNGSRNELPSDPNFAFDSLTFDPEPLTLDFSNFAPGESIEGSGTVHPLLTITALSGDGVALFEGKDPAAYGSPNPGIQNGGIAPTGGFGDISPGRSHDFVFTFNGGYTVNHFSLHMLDYGDTNPGLATSHSITLEALDINGASVDMHTLSYTGDADRLAGDAAASPGQPGNFIFTVSGPGISMVRLLYSNNGSRNELPSDPNFAFDSLTFNLEPLTNAGPDKIICNTICDKVVLDGRKSYHPYAEIVAYEWVLNHHEDYLCDESTSGKTPTVTDLCSGTYDVTLTTTGDDGSTGKDKMKLTVLEQCNPCSIMQGDFDSDGDVDGDDLKIFVQNFGTFPLTP